MVILAINSASFTGRLALINEQKVVEEKHWKACNNESEYLLPAIIELLKVSDLGFNDLDKIVVISGPGPFTALRVSIAVANTLAYALNKPVVGVSLMEYWKNIYKGDFILNAGQNRIFYKNVIIDFDEFLREFDIKKELSGELREDQIEKIKKAGIKWIDVENLPSFGQAVLTLAQNNFKGYDEKEIVAPLYFSAPQITKSTKTYK
ncbi:tRNA (adenosine(37)-N6)-threonylcarbamoyltransferase complex dimerization subunit type 1 TsaB [Candidatus Peregrinibacteria bacterium]|nr:tRNA (adenosine(37)-N6)-threonylcarbamoyltransferase complex dimerization subunit type 1 TsaB [Candidatus Peregrinibacteria bacterium]